MLLVLKNKETLKLDSFSFKCCVGKKGLNKFKKEGDGTTPIGTYGLGNIYYRSDRVSKPVTNFNCIKIKKNMGWCDDPSSKFYNKLIDIKLSANKEKIYRKDNKYDYFLVINYNRKKIVKNKGSAIFLHLTKNFKSTAGCIGVSQKDFLIIVKLLKKNSKIKIS